MGTYRYQNDKQCGGDNLLNKRILKKIHSQSGESIGETLVALLISTLGILMLAGMIVASTRLIMYSRDTFVKYYVANNAVAIHDVSLNGEAIDNAETNSIIVTMTPGASSMLSTRSMNGSYYANVALGNNLVVSYSVP